MKVWLSSSREQSMLTGKSCPVLADGSHQVDGMQTSKLGCIKGNQILFDGPLWIVV